MQAQESVGLWVRPDPKPDRLLAKYGKSSHLRRRATAKLPGRVKGGRLGPAPGPQDAGLQARARVS